MASNNLGASFSIDVSDLKSGLAEANRLIRESESEFQAAAAGMDDWSDSAEGLQKRVDSLTDQVDIQKKKVEALVAEKKNIIDTMTQEGKSNEEIEKAVDNVNKSIQREGKQLNDLKSKLDRSKKSLDKYESATDDAADTMEDLAEETEDTRDATDKLTDEIDDQKKKLEKLKREYTNVVLEQGDTSDESLKLKKQIKDLSKELQTNEKKLNAAADGLEDMGDGAKDAGKKIDLSKAAIIGFASAGVAKLVSGAKDAVSALINLADETQEYRESMTRLDTAFEQMGLTAENASDTFKTLYSVLGDNDKALESAQFLAQYADDEKELAEQTRILTGVFATYGDSIPTEGLAEGIAATIKMGEVQGVLADALEWQGINLDDFNEKLGKLSTDKEREALITETLNGLYGEAADAYAKNNESVIAARDATARYEEAMAGLGEKMEPVKTALTSAKATIVEAVTPAVGALAEGFVTLVEKITGAEEATDLLSETQRAAVTASQEAGAEYEALKQKANELAGAQMANVDYASRLISQLKGLVDENGNVKESDQARVDFILGELNSALGTEYTKLGDIIDQNGKVKQSVYDVIEAKKAQIMLAAYEDVYREAVENVAGAEKARAIQAQELAKQEEVTDAAYKAAKDARIELDKKVANAKGESDLRSLASEANMVQGLEREAEKQNGILDDKRKEYNTTNATLEGYYKDINGYETASTLLMEGETRKALGYLGKMGNGFQTAASTAQLAADEQKAVLEQQVIDTEVNAELMRAAYEQGVEGVTEDMVTTAKEQADAAKEEFKKVGGEITEGIADGAGNKEWTLTSKMKSLVSAALSAAKKAAGIASPSKLFKREVGKFIGEGVAVGVDESTKDVVRSIGRQVKAARDAYDVGEINSSISRKVNAKGGSQNGSDALASGSNGAASGGVTVYQTNHYSQAHSRYELYKSKQDTAAAVRLALGGAY